jgi:ribosomal protein L11 methylase PrmA
MTEKRESSSFRDPSGYVFQREGELFRQVNLSYRENYSALKSTGLERSLIDRGLLVRAPEVALPQERQGSLAILKPERVPFISYPYEWCFSQLKDAALLTLELQQSALKHGMTLKDASAYNIQFLNGKPILIDTLSFETYREGDPWIAYRQFCRHFLGPLALMSTVDVRLGHLSAAYLDGIPLDLTSKLLPGISKLKPGLLTHIHVHAKAETHQAGASNKVGTISKLAMEALIDSLKATVTSLQWSPGGTEWSDYYSDNNYTDQSMSAKRKMVAAAIDLVKSSGTIPTEKSSCWDLGANTGEFSRIAAEKGFETVAWDIDPSAVEKNYLTVKNKGESNLLPLLQDLTNPSCGLGWMSSERKSLIDRGPAELVIALALIHHLAIGNNLPLPMIAEFFGKVCRFVLVEFVPKSDSQVQRMLSHREDIFQEYDLEGWRKAFTPYFNCLADWQIAGSERTLFVLEKRG